MTSEGFEKLMNNALYLQEELDRWEKFGIPLYDLPIYDMSWEFFNIALDELFNEEGIDWINWWLFERISFISGLPNKAYDADGKEIPMDSIDNLWEMVKDLQK